MVGTKEIYDTASPMVQASSSQQIYSLLLDIGVRVCSKANLSSYTLMQLFSAVIFMKENLKDSAIMNFNGKM